MRYTFIQDFGSTMYLSKEQALEVAKENAIKEFGRLLLEHAEYKVRDDGSIRITVDI